MKIVDLSHALVDGMPVYPGTAPPTFAVASRLELQGYREVRIDMGTHTGTHLDVPAHFLGPGATLDEFPLERFVGPAAVLDVSALRGRELGPGELAAAQDLLPGLAFLLLHSGWDRYWGDGAYYSGFPTLSPRGAEWLLQRGLTGIGTDGPSLDPLGSADYPAHRALMGGGALILENLTRLGELPSGKFLLSCLPLPLPGADGSPVRAVAIIEGT